METRQVPCPLCLSETYKPKYVANLGLTVVECGNCNLLFANPQPTLDALSNFYKPGLERWTNEEDYCKTRLPYFSYYLSLLKKYSQNNAPQTVLDIGCGKGIFLDFLKNYLDVATIGLEISDEDVTAASTRVDLVIHQDVSYPISDPSIPRADIVTILDVMEHLPKPNETLQTIRSMTNSGALLLIDTGNIGGFGPRFGGSKNPFVQDAGHIVFYSKKTISRLLEQNSFLIRSFHSEKEVFTTRRLGLHNIGWEIEKRFTSSPNMIILAQRSD